MKVLSRCSRIEVQKFQVRQGKNATLQSAHVLRCKLHADQSRRVLIISILNLSRPLVLAEAAEG